MIETAAAALLAIGLLLFDALCIPKPGMRVPPRSLAGTMVLLSFGLSLFGFLLLLTGAPVTAAVVTLLLAACLTLISNVKHAVLGEPLVFSDFALVVAVFQQPQFYISALKRWQIVALVGGLIVLIGCIAGFSNAEIAPRLLGAALMLAGGVILAGLLRLSAWQNMANMPDLAGDVRQHGLVAATLVYWSHWRKLADPPECDLPAIPAAGDLLVVVVQSESFSDPDDLFGAGTGAMPGLATARAAAMQSGRLIVPGFGAYTMRTEYGVLFGRNEQQLGVRRFDPFLTARGETSWALPRRLQREGWTSHFLHPHDLRFYGRDRLMPEAGFDRIVGAEGFAPPPLGDGRYVTDAAVGDVILETAKQAAGPTLIYAVTIENHGPWPVESKVADKHLPYLRLLQRSDAMLLRLVEEQPRLGRPVILCFFGDHRPSIPQASEPGGDRHTPYVIASFGSDGKPHASVAGPVDLTPAELHHVLLAAIGSGLAKR